MPGKSELEGQLAVVAGFADPRAELEQYPTPPELAATVIHTADLNGDIQDRTIVDLGTGTGMLALGAALRSPHRVIGVDIDRSPLQTAIQNEHRVGATAPIHWVQADVTAGGLSTETPTVVVMNPPFGAQYSNRHADREFLTVSADIADVSYSIHNEGSEEFVTEFAADRAGTITHAFAAEFSVSNQFSFHTSETEQIQSEVFRIEWM
ncbi:MAG: putative RNA methylase [Haloquadratum sp. J07HQX50]|jgi:methyltransferase (EC 2.1.1.-)|nr:MAG: putative RNA methylase [Haloquadratum sp. J07HQX50]